MRNDSGHSAAFLGHIPPESIFRDDLDDSLRKADKEKREGAKWRLRASGGGGFCGGGNGS